ncbi:YheC/YheD family protein [Paenibacillus cineris]|uniref:Endospore coat-associated protein n=1 Tax=Paenibacillus cineris TaxID=237530 RepID=A0ABQ4LL94_9BACL|nr:YheC/YheD family protein [Paenibacillus cineris]GIO57279.1 hypothetical protein J21TS7_55970 [Paenibacillus cineris]
MGEKNRTAVVSKWIKTKVLLGSKEVRPFMLDTRKISKTDLKEMLKSYRMVYVKPENGTHGKGVIRAEQLENGDYTYQVETVKKTFGSYDPFYQSLQKLTGKRSYLIQKGIHLVKYRKRRFDIRVMVQRRPGGDWEATGLIGRVAREGKIVTNYHSGGTPMDVKTLLGAHLNEKETAKVIQSLNKLGVTTAKHLHKKYPGFRHIGLDIGFDRTWTPWIIEVNTMPDPYIFNQLKDKSMYRKVMKFRQAWK